MLWRLRLSWKLDSALVEESAERAGLAAGGDAAGVRDAREKAAADLRRQPTPAERQIAGRARRVFADVRKVPG